MVASHPAHLTGRPRPRFAPPGAVQPGDVYISAAHRRGDSEEKFTVSVTHLPACAISRTGLRELLPPGDSAPLATAAAALRACTLVGRPTASHTVRTRTFTAANMHLRHVVVRSVSVGIERRPRRATARHPSTVVRCPRAALSPAGSGATAAATDARRCGSVCVGPVGPAAGVRCVAAGDAVPRLDRTHRTLRLLAAHSHKRAHPFNRHSPPIRTQPYRCI